MSPRTLRISSIALFADRASRGADRSSPRAGWCRADLALDPRAHPCREQLESVDLPEPLAPTTPMPLAAPHEQIDAIEERAPAALGAEPARVEHDVARARRLAKRKRTFSADGPDVLRAIHRVELVEHLAAALRLLRLLPGDVLADEVLGLGDEVPCLSASSRSRSRSSRAPPNSPNI
jgi:hypothetical protein